MFYKNKYQIGDQVKSTLNDQTGYIKCIIEKSSNDSIKYSYLILSLHKYYIESEEFIKLVKKVSPEDDSDSVKKLRSIAESCGYKSDLKVGDIVTFRRGPIGQFVVSSIIEMGYGEELWHYELIPIYNGELDSEVCCTCGRLLLELQYHDTNWEEYFTEGTCQNGLPAWRGELYNFMKLPETSYSLYDNDTLPTDKMKHILDKHSIYRRLESLVTSSKKNKEGISRGGTDQLILTKMNRSESELIEIKKRIMLKIRYYNGIIPKSDLPKHNTSFDFEEQKLISIIGDYDKNVIIEDEKNERKDHYPPYMSDYAIMNAIKEAYDNAEKIEERSHGKTRAANPEGVILFQGTSKDGLNIQFYYDFDYDEITTAYPVFVDTTNRPDIRHPENKNKKRQN